ncbi:MMPL family transporter [Paenibacillus aurantius]|uniref:MMPL family transporter n=1 Tax=Paenibacillus aurantius TaxID=2918900 RepID=A0AA96RHX3_9BACL|nr:MMPL family transporter [Paenibacillus aurantius]WNQ13858.1 MMPL family transporter [Paenibacillus aurantius]
MLLLRLGMTAFRFPRTVLMLWGMLLALSAGPAFDLPGVLKDHGLVADGSYLEVKHRLSAEFGIPEDPVLVLFNKRSGASGMEFIRFIKRTMEELKEVPGVRGYLSPLEKEGMLKDTAAYGILILPPAGSERTAVVTRLRDKLPLDLSATVRLTGKPVVQQDVNVASRRDLGRAERIGLPAAFLILWWAFRGPVSALLPVAAGLTAVVTAMGALSRLGQAFELSHFVLNVVPMVGIALSIDFALLLVSRYREELGRLTAEKAMNRTLRTAGRAVFYSACCVALGLAGICSIRLPMFQSVTAGALTVLAAAVLAAFTLLPAALALLTPVMKSRNRERGLAGTSRPDLWQRLARQLLARPFRTGGLALILLAIGMMPLRTMGIAIPDASSLPAGYESRAAAEAYEELFGEGGKARVDLLLQGKPGLSDKEVREEVYRLVDKLKRDPQVLRVDTDLLIVPPAQGRNEGRPSSDSGMAAASLGSPSTAGTSVLLPITLRAGTHTKEAREWVRSWDREGSGGPVAYRLGGEAKYEQEVFDAVRDGLPASVGFIGTSTFLVLLIAFRSFVIAVKAIVMNALSLAASFGILAAVFSQGAFGMEPYPVALMIPVFVFGLVFGVSMDYGIFMLSRMAEHYQLTGDNERAVTYGVASTSRLLTAAAAIMVAVTLPFAFGEVVGVRQLGVGIAAAVALDATVIRLMLVPPLMKLLGDWNWRLPKLFR